MILYVILNDILIFNRVLIFGLKCFEVIKKSNMLIKNII